MRQTRFAGRREIERKYEHFRPGIHVCLSKNSEPSQRELASELSYLEQEAASVLVDGVIEELRKISRRRRL